MKEKIVFYYRGPIERYSMRSRGRWLDGYSEQGSNGEVIYPWLSFRDCQREAKQRGAVAVFVKRNAGV